MKSLLMAAALLTQQGGGQPDSAFCAEFFRVYDQRANGFAALRGAQDVGENRWTPLVDLPGARRCYIQDLAGRVSYICSWEVQGGGDAAAISAARDLANGMRGCFEARGTLHGPILDQKGEMGGLFYDALPINSDVRMRAITAAHSIRSRATVFLTLEQR